MLQKDKPTHTFWMVSAPNPNTNIDEIKGQTRKWLNADVKKLGIPKKLKVGTLDGLYNLSDSLSKIDNFVEQTTRKIARQMKDLYTEINKGGDADVENSFVVGNVGIDTYMLSFEWNNAKFKPDVPLGDLVDAISTEMSRIDEELRTMQSEYISLGHILESSQRQKHGNLASRDLSDGIIPDSAFVDSQHLTTVFVVIPKHSYKIFQNSYEHLGGEVGVVPRSAQEIITEGEQMLIRVVLMKQIKNDFRAKAAEYKWVVREISPPTAEDESAKNKLEESEERKETLRGDLTRWCRSNFAEAFTNWAHLKVIRMFVESILRYGLPQDFVCLIMEIQPKKEKNIRNYFDSYYKALSSGYLESSTQDVAVAGTTDKFYAYVFSDMAL